MPLTLLSPDLARLAGSAPRLPALELLLARADLRPAPESGMHQLLADIFGLTSLVAEAPLTRLADTGHRDDALWFRADPVHLIADRDQLVMLPASALDIQLDEARALAGAFNDLYAGEGFLLETPVASRWYLRVPGDLQCLTYAPEQIAGGPVFDFMPAGADAPRLKQLMNEIQMLFHAHPVNQAREAAGRLLINTAWLWGGGYLPAETVRAPGRVTSNLPLVRGLALLAGSEYLEWSGLLDESAFPATGLLALQMHSAGELQSFEKQIAQPLLGALRQGSTASVIMYPGGDFIYEVSSSMLHRFWRRGRPLQDLPGLK